GKEEEINIAEYNGYQAFVTFLLCAAPRFDVGKCDRCGSYFWNRWGKANKRFCGRRCSVIGTATERQARRVARQRREKNVRISRAVDTLVRDEPATADWKTWVARRGRVTVSYLTRALNRGAQGKPDGLRLHKLQRTYLEKLNKGGR